MHSIILYRPIPNISAATKIRLREHFTAEIFYRRKYPELRYSPLAFTDLAISRSALPTSILILSASVRPLKAITGRAIIANLCCHPQLGSTLQVVMVWIINFCRITIQLQKVQLIVLSVALIC